MYAKTFLLAAALAAVAHSASHPAVSCDSLLTATELADVKSAISSHAVALFGLKDYRCTMAAEATLSEQGVCYEKHIFTGTSDARLSYFKCKYAAEIGDIGSGSANMDHSYFFVGGKYLGDGFKATTTPSYGDAKMTCHKACSGILSKKEEAEMQDVITNAPVALYGWGGCPCTNVARNRFSELGVCYLQNVWPDWHDKKFKYLQCVYGEENHSFIFLKGKFIGNGFKFDHKVMSAAVLDGLLKTAGAKRSCIKVGDTNLMGRRIHSCTQDDDGTTSGWTRSGACNWDPSDGGYHEVCVKMSEDFLQSSAKNDANDLSSVVSPGGHWCICAWAFASAVERDPAHLQGITLECDSTNSKLRHVYQHFITTGEALTSPSGVSYEASTALTYVNKLCGKDEAADKAEAKLLATHKKTHLRTALVKTNHQHAHAPQSESGAMATEHANHGAPVGNHMGTMASATPMGGQHVMPMGER